MTAFEQAALKIAAPAILLAVLGGCQQTFLRHSGSAWSQDGTVYTIGALPDGRLLPDAWTLANFDQARAGLLKHDYFDERDLFFRRAQDGGRLVVATEQTKPQDAGEPVDVLADRWVDSMVVSPRAGDTGIFQQDGKSGTYDPVLPDPADHRDLGHYRGRFVPATVEPAQFEAKVERREKISVPGADGVALTIRTHWRDGGEEL